MHRRNIGQTVGIALIWSMLWIVLALVVGTIVGTIDPSQIDAGEEPVALAPMIGLVGFLCGLAFAVLAPSDGEPNFAVRRSRIVAWGFVLAAVVPVVTGKGLSEILVIAPIGAVSAVVSVALMRRMVAQRPADITS